MGPWLTDNSDRDCSFVRHLAVWRHAIDYAGEMLAKLRQEVVRRHPGLVGHGLHLIVAENRMQLLRRDWLVGAVADPRLSNMAQSSFLESGEKAAKATSRPGGSVVTAAQHVHQDTPHPGG